MDAVRRRKAPTRDTASATTTERRFGKRYAGVCNSERRTRRAIGIGVARAASNVDKYDNLNAEVHTLPLRGATGIGARVRYAAWYYKKALTATVQMERSKPPYTAHHWYWCARKVRSVGYYKTA